MKRLFTILAAVLLTASLFAQAPQKMSYQAVIRNSLDQLVTNHAVGMRVSILQGVNPVYVETHATNTNANGLVTIEIGNGTVVSGVFASIDWSSGTYSIKTETDPTGGVNYTAIVGTSQLLSVPYALYAKTGENVTGIVAIANGGTGATSVSGAKTSLGLGNVDNTTDLLKPVSTATQTVLDLKAPLASPTFTGTVAGITKSMVGLGNVDNTTDLLKPISTATQTALDLKAPLASPTFTGTPLATTATPGTNTTQIATTAFVTSAVAASVPAHYLGEEYNGGIIFYIYKGSDGLQHGLIVSKTETTATWSGSTLVGADRTEDGAYNMNLMPTGAGTARFWVEALGTGWYLPSIDELSLLWHSRYHVNKTARAISSTLLSTIANWWSSTEYTATNAFTFNWYTGYTYYSKTNGYSVRAVRAF